jgi:hypothetical protein
MARFNTNTFRSLNESIARIQNPQAALNEAMEYTSILETVILDLCEALDLDPQALVEDVMTVARQKEHHKKLNPLYKKNAKIGYNAPEEKKIEKQIEKARYGRGGYSTEMRSKKLYGRGGKVLKRKPTNRDVHAGADNDERGYTG